MCCDEDVLLLCVMSAATACLTVRRRVAEAAVAVQEVNGQPQHAAASTAHHIQPGSTTIVCCCLVSQCAHLIVAAAVVCAARTFLAGAAQPQRCIYPRTATPPHSCNMRSANSFTAMTVLKHGALIARAASTCETASSSVGVVQSMWTVLPSCSPLPPPSVYPHIPVAAAICSSSTSIRRSITDYVAALQPLPPHRPHSSTHNPPRHILTSGHSTRHCHSSIT